MNYIRGTIDSDVDFLIVGRTVISEQEIRYGTYMNLDGMTGFFGSLMDYQKYATGKYQNLKPSVFRSSSDGLKFTFSRIGYLEGVDSVTEYKLPVPVVTTSNDTTVSFNDLNGKTTTTASSLFLKPELPLDPRTLFSGAWYSLADVHDNVLWYNWFAAAPRTVNGFNTSVLDTPSLSSFKTDIMFVPFSYLGWKVINGNYVPLDAASDFMLYVDRWIKGDKDFDQAGCEDVLAQKTTTNCIFTIGTIQGLPQSLGFGHGWRYCNNGESCADGCFGRCEEHVNKNSKWCSWSHLRGAFVAGKDIATDDPDVETKATRVFWLKIAIMAIFILAFFGFFIFVMLKHAGHAHA